MSVPLRAISPHAPGGQTVSRSDALALLRDLMLAGNCFVEPTGLDDPTHRRIPPSMIHPTNPTQEATRRWAP